MWKKAHFWSLFLSQLWCRKCTFRVLWYQRCFYKRYRRCNFDHEFSPRKNLSFSTDKPFNLSSGRILAKMIQHWHLWMKISFRMIFSENWKLKISMNILNHSLFLELSAPVFRFVFSKWIYSGVKILLNGTNVFENLVLISRQNNWIIKNNCVRQRTMFEIFLHWCQFTWCDIIKNKNRKLIRK